MVEWLAGNRIRGTSTERTSATGFNPVDAISGGWKEIGRTTLGSAGTTIDVSSLPDKRYLMILEDMPKPVNARANARFNTDSTNNYAGSYNMDGGANTGYASASSVYHEASGTNLDAFSVVNVVNLAGKEKLQNIHSVAQVTAGSGTAPSREENTGQWGNASDSINAVNIYSHNANFDSGSEVVVLGWDPADTHTTNFWEELASVNADGTGNALDSGVFTAKKYLWIQSYTEYLSGAHISPQLQVGNGTIDTGANYAVRYSDNGTVDNAWTGTSNIAYGYVGGGDNKPIFTNTFIINNAGQEKLSINHAIEAETAGAGYEPSRVEDVGKWANTSAQINRVQWGVNTGNISNKSTMRVWGSD